MTQPTREKKKRREAPARVVVETASLDSADPFDDPKLDEFLAQTVDAGEEPPLLIVDQLITRNRVRREV